MPRALTMLARRMGGCAVWFGGGEAALVCFDGTTRGVATCVMRRPSCRAIDCGPAVHRALTAPLLPSSAQRLVGAWRLRPLWCTRTRDSGVARVSDGPRSPRTYLVRTWASARRTSAPSVVAGGGIVVVDEQALAIEVQPAPVGGACTTAQMDDTQAEFMLSRDITGISHFLGY